MKGSDNDRLVRTLVDEGIIRTHPVEEAMRRVDRKLFVPDRLLDESYRDHPLSIGYGQTISAPHMVAIMAEELLVERGQTVLEIGTGSGYHAAVISRLVGDEGQIHTIEVVPELVRFARERIGLAGFNNIIVHEGDGSIGLPEAAPFDRLYYTCSSPKVPHEVLRQLREGGIGLGVVGPKYSTQRLIRYRITGGEPGEEPLTYCIFVPLVGRYGY